MVPPCSDRISRVPPYSNGRSFYTYGAITLYGQAFQLVLLVSLHGLVRVRSPLLAEYRLISFPLGTEMFHFPRFAPAEAGTLNGWVSPFGHSRIKACSQLPVTFRSVPRPSSPPTAKASTRCS